VAQHDLDKITAGRQRLVLCRLVIEIMRSLHGAYAPSTEPFGNRLETFFIGVCVVLGDIEGKPFSVSKIAAYMRVPRTTAMRRLKRLESWGLVYRQGRRYYVHEKALNSVMGLRSYQHIRRMLSKAADDLTVLDTLPD
jgi:DNA-binding transcriptional ArsR family regulator